MIAVLDFCQKWKFHSQYAPKLISRQQGSAISQKEVGRQDVAKALMTLERLDIICLRSFERMLDGKT